MSVPLVLAIVSAVSGPAVLSVEPPEVELVEGEVFEVKSDDVVVGLSVFVVSDVAVLSGDVVGPELVAVGLNWPVEMSLVVAAPKDSELPVDA